MATYEIGSREYTIAAEKLAALGYKSKEENYNPVVSFRSDTQIDGSITAEYLKALMDDTQINAGRDARIIGLAAYIAQNGNKPLSLADLDTPALGGAREGLLDAINENNKKFAMDPYATLTEEVIAEDKRSVIFAGDTLDDDVIKKIDEAYKAAGEPYTPDQVRQLSQNLQENFLTGDDKGTSPKDAADAVLNFVRNANDSKKLDSDGVTDIITSFRDNSIGDVAKRKNEIFAQFASFADSADYKSLRPNLEAAGGLTPTAASDPKTVTVAAKPDPEMQRIFAEASARSEPQIDSVVRLKSPSNNEILLGTSRVIQDMRERAAADTRIAAGTPLDGYEPKKQEPLRIAAGTPLDGYEPKKQQPLRVAAGTPLDGYEPKKQEPLRVAAGTPLDGYEPKQQQPAAEQPVAETPPAYDKAAVNAALKDFLAAGHDKNNANDAPTLAALRKALKIEDGDIEITNADKTPKKGKVDFISGVQFDTAVVSLGAIAQEALSDDEKAKKMADAVKGIKLTHDTKGIDDVAAPPAVKAAAAETQKKGVQL